MPVRIRTVLIAVLDPSARKQPAIERGEQIAAALGARAIVFHAAFESYLSGRPFFDSKRLARSRGWLIDQRSRQLEKRAAALRQRGIPTEVRVVWEEPAHEAIVRASIASDVDLVVTGPQMLPRGRILGASYTEWELLRMCPRPLLLVRAVPPQAASMPILAALDPTHADDKPAALDTSLARHAAAFASALGVELHAVHCIRPSIYALGEDTPTNRQREERKMRAKIRSTLTRSRIRADEIHVLHGAVEKATLDLAREIDAQMIVMGAISRRGLKRFAIGNTAERVISEAPCDLLIVKPPGFKPRLGRNRKQEVVLPAKRTAKASARSR